MTDLQTLEHWAATTPDVVAIVSDDKELTYQQWNESADRLADHLHHQGVRTGDRVAVRSRIRPDWFIANRAIGKIGAEHLALNWRLTPRECRQILAHAGAVALVVDDLQPAELLQELEALNLRSVLTLAPGLRSDWDAILTGPAVPAREGPSQVPQLVYTSGTTGLPKGVSWLDRRPSDPVQRDIYFDAIANTPPRTERPRTLLTMPLHHSAGYYETVFTHQRRGLVCLLDPFDPERALQLIQDRAITHWLAVPTMFLRIRSLPKHTFDSYNLSSLRTLQTGAAPVPQSLKTWIAESFGNEVLWELYGTTEVATISSMGPRDHAQRPGSSGRPLPGVELRVVDGAWRDVPLGQTGEIAVKTPATIGRYFGQKPFGNEAISADGFLRTGDAGHLDQDGFVYITDRYKDMIVAGGSNIYPAEIEAALLEYPAILDCAVVGIPHDDLGEQPVAFVELRPGCEATQDEVLAFLLTRLAKYKHPRQVHLGGALPRNTVGKVLKQELREPYWRGRERAV
jgi:long-chain acyl-CoA synthetase